MESKILLQAIGGSLVFLLCLNIYLWVKLSNINKKYAILMKDNEDKTLQDMFINRVEQMNAALQEVSDIKVDQIAIRKQMKSCLQKTGTVRFNAYGDIAGEMSYAIAILDEQNNGVVFSCLTSRQDVRCYARSVQNAQSTTKYALSAEEQKAVQLAQDK